MLRQPCRPGPDKIRYRLPGSAAAPPGIVEAGGQPAFRLERAAAEPGAALVLRDLEGIELYRIDPPALRLRDSLSIDSGPQTVAVVRKVLEPPFREEFRVAVPEGHVWIAAGHIAASDYRLRDHGETIATVSPLRDRPGGGCEVRVGGTSDVALVLMMVVAINELAPPHTV